MKYELRAHAFKEKAPVNWLAVTIVKGCPSMSSCSHAKLYYDIY